MNQNFRILAGIVLVAGFLALIVFLAPFLGFKLEPEKCEVDQQGNVISCPHEKQVQDILSFLPFIVSLAMVVGAGTYYWMSSKLESKDKSLKQNTKVILKLLNQDEQKVIELLVENNGKALQAQVTRLPGMTKLKSHRVIQKLVDRGVLKKEELGKTNTIKFTPEIQEGLL